MERTEAGWGRPAEDNPRWRSLLDRALLGKGGPEDDDYDGRFSEERLAQARTARYADEDYRANGYADQDYREAGYGRQGYGGQGYEPRRDDYGDYPQQPPQQPPQQQGYDQRSNGYGYQQAQQPAPLQQAAPYIPQQATAPRGYPGTPQPQQPRPLGTSGYEAMRPATPRPTPAPYQQDQYNGQQYRGY